MNWDSQAGVGRLIEFLNADILRELRMAEDCIHRAATVARPYFRFQRQITECAASAYSNACALAAEVLVLGGVPPSGRAGIRLRPGPVSIEEYLAQAQRLLAHYQMRLAMSERFGLSRLREVFRDIILTKRSHLEHAALIAATAERPRQLG